jgi:hypothetical protein
VIFVAEFRGCPEVRKGDVDDPLRNSALTLPRYIPLKEVCYMRIILIASSRHRLARRGTPVGSYRPASWAWIRR